MAYTVKNLLNTSVDDCKCDLPNINDVTLLRELLEACNQSNHKTRSDLVAVRIFQLAGMKYRDGEYSPELGDHAEVYSAEFEPEMARVIAIGKSKIKITYDNDSIKPRSEWIHPANSDMVSREQ